MEAKLHGALENIPQMNARRLLRSIISIAGAKYSRVRHDPALRTPGIGGGGEGQETRVASVPGASPSLRDSPRHAGDSSAWHGHTEPLLS